jgi:hypothetical protein
MPRRQSPASSPGGDSPGDIRHSAHAWRGTSRGMGSRVVRGEQEPCQRHRDAWISSGGGATGPSFRAASGCPDRTQRGSRCLCRAALSTGRLPQTRRGEARRCRVLVPEFVHSTSPAPAGWRTRVAGGAEEPLLARRIRSSKRRRQDAYAAPRRRRTRARSRRLSLRLREPLCSPARTPRCRGSWHENARRRLCPVPAVGSGDPAQGPLLGERRRVGRFWTMGFEPGQFVWPPLRLARIEPLSSYRSVSLSRWFSRFVSTVR